MTTGFLVSFSLFVVLALIATLGFLMEWLHERWRYLPNFVYNTVGKVTAVCSVSDFEETKRKIAIGAVPGNRKYVVVPNTALFGERPSNVPVEYYSTRWAGTEDDRRWSSAAVALHEPSLFVPFVSERHLSFVEQARYCVYFANTGRDAIYPFMEAGLRANRKVDYRKRFTAFYWKNDWIPVVKWFSVVFAVCSLLLSGIFFMDGRDEARLEEPGVFYTSTLGSSELTEHKGTKREVYALSVSNHSFESPWISVGSVESVIQVGGGLVHACIFRKSEEMSRCGFASTALGLKEGALGYLRQGGYATTWKDARGSRGEFTRWFVSEEEALALQGKAGYQLKR